MADVAHANTVERGKVPTPEDLATETDTLEWFETVWLAPFFASFNEGSPASWTSVANGHISETRN